jgi:hypothetical protein
LLNLAVGALVAPFGFGDPGLALLNAMVIASVCTGGIVFLPGEGGEEVACATNRACAAFVVCVGTFFFFLFGFIILIIIDAIGAKALI